MSSATQGGNAWGPLVTPGSGGGADGNDLVAVSANDTTPNYLLPKLSAGTGILLTELNDGGNEQVEIAANQFISTTTVAGTTYNLLDSDVCKLIRFTNAADITVTLPSGLTAGWHATLAQLGTGQVIVVAGGGVTINEPDGNDRTAKQYAQIMLTNEASESYLLSGYTAGP